MKNLLKKNYLNIKNLERLRATGAAGSSDRKEISNPFVHTAHGNPAFTPQKAGKASASVKLLISCYTFYTMTQQFLLFKYT